MRILVAEDNESNKLITSQMLKNIGFTADIVNNGSQAVQAARKKEYDLILMDCLMPEMDGYEATKLIRQQENKLIPAKIIALTASLISDERRKCLEAGMNDFLPKPFTKIDLINLLNNHFGILKSSDILDSEINIGQHPLTQILNPKILNQFLEIEKNGEKNFVAEMIDLYLSHSQEYLDKMQSAFVRREKKELKNITHYLRGSTANIGFTSLFQELTNLENEVEREDWLTAEKTVINILGNFRQLKEKSSDLTNLGDYKNET